MEKDFFTDLLKEVDNSLKNDISNGIKEYGIFDFKKSNKKSDISTEQKYASLNFKYGELINITPINPMFPPGTIIGCVNKAIPKETTWGLGCKPCASDDDESLEKFNFISTDEGKKRTLDSLPAVRKIMNVTAMVTEELIEIRKFYHSTKGFNALKHGEKLTVSYKIVHLLHLINGNEKIIIPTMLFDPNFNERAGGEKSELNHLVIFEEEFDMRLIKTIYQSADPDSIIDPLSILSKP